MRFRGKLVDIGCIQHFTKVIGMLAKLAKTCVLRMTVDKLYFILSEQVVNGGVSIWCELAQGHFFNEYSIDGLSAEANEIFLEVIPENFMKALKTSQVSKSIKVKLTKKHTPCLTFEIEMPSTHSRFVTHDVPVHVIPKRLWAEYDEPAMPEFDVSIYMPSLKVLRNVVDRMKTMSNFIIISANRSGEFIVKVETDSVTIATHFRDLKNPVFGKPHQDAAAQLPSQSTQQQKREEFAETRIDIKKFAQFLAGQQVNPNKVICNIVENKVAHFFLLHDDVSLQYFMPAVSL
ncbi:checkpoint protein HUS1-like [Tubulanus polymorphus]|uniref:checkpoint protein HUS1-like n=1 Tax=Tubulanus polymorphus TaxID=672921 RepID=UPI003DA3401F